ncbi:glycosyltransferase family 4 protein [Roseateles saccharophilus]|uniref:Glycosyltransferase involved in cell wall biosynthesis n=1 Tax=Roseateles saccharophilus TaxID=304 RepID=A0A4R3UR99_ROSSA|nr:glycosyltransferase family 4 protein [Roseateles saccharophilus]MDG0833458.1 glycosyltransferase [Roseateles saccharophilus]TCU93113.1 glycosyltransferase involved in cell wall biosynthesis [Roseateles saccharophilus]
MKIAVVVPGGVDASGEVRVIPALLALLGRLAVRHEVHVYALRQQLEPGSWWLCGARVHNIGGRSGRLGQLRAIWAIAREHRVAHFDVLQSIWSGPCGTVAVVAARLLGLRCAVHLAGGELAAVSDIGYGGCLGWRGRLREAWVLKGANALTAASQPMLEQIEALGLHGQRLPLGVDLAQCPPCPPRRRQPGEALRLVQVASLNRVKDQACLLHALARLRELGVDAGLDLVGEDTLGGEVQALADRLGLAGCVRFHGFLTQRALWPVLASGHVHVVTSRHEAGPLSALEAAVLGVPSVGTAVGHLAEWAPHAALVVAPGDSLGLAAVLARLAGDEALRLRLAVQAQRFAIAEDADQTCLRFEHLHAELRCDGS